MNSQICKIQKIYKLWKNIELFLVVFELVILIILLPTFICLDVFESVLLNVTVPIINVAAISFLKNILFLIIPNYSFFEYRKILKKLQIDEITDDFSKHHINYFINARIKLSGFDKKITHTDINFLVAIFKWFLILISCTSDWNFGRNFKINFRIILLIFSWTIPFTTMIHYSINGTRSLLLLSKIYENSSEELKVFLEGLSDKGIDGQSIFKRITSRNSMLSENFKWQIEKTLNSNYCN